MLTILYVHVIVCYKLKYILFFSQKMFHRGVFMLQIKWPLTEELQICPCDTYIDTAAETPVEAT